LFPVEIRLVERTEQTSTARISSIQKWLDNQGFEPSTFRYTFFQDGLVLRVDFALQPEAVAFGEGCPSNGVVAGQIDRFLARYLHAPAALCGGEQNVTRVAGMMRSHLPGNPPGRSQFEWNKGQARSGPVCPETICSKPERL